ncbi:hypothetical protein BJ944DRAFT_274066 [Cunninghamella echinulata]|nr:hypothetical protein BJ944DRAFT_274066 [Cunninghamella echinulata]
MSSDPFPSQEEVQEIKNKLVGKYVLGPEEVVTEINENEVVRSNTLKQPVRVINPGDPVTRDLIPNRMNVLLDENKKVTNVYFS